MEEHAREASDVSATSPTGRSVWDNMRDVVLAPSATFEDVRARPRWLVPLLVIMAATLVTSFIMMPLYTELQRAGVMARDMPAEQREQALQAMETFKYVGLIAGPLLVAIFTAIFALLFWGWAAISGAREPTYKIAFTALIYTGVIQILQAVAQAIVVALKGAEQVAREGGPPTFGLALFMERGDMPALLWGLLANINFFSIWGAVVVAIAGVHAMRMGKGGAWGFAILLWLIGGLFLAFSPGAS
ncbi:MAG TPA: YIP1 family protein [Gemmatimonadota bacterium]|nr:YIP1 family protein [Gemmatimonadota bacterium]